MFGEHLLSEASSDDAICVVGAKHGPAKKPYENLQEKV